MRTTMIFEDYESLSEAIKGLRAESKPIDTEADVEFLYQASLPFFHQVATYELESLFRTELDKPQAAQREEAVPAAEIENNLEEAMQVADRALEQTSAFLVPCRQEDMFKPATVTTDGKPNSSLLSKNLLSPQNNPQFGAIKLTIYLPDCTPMVIYTSETSTYEQVIAKVIAAHKQKGIQPPLRYDDPSFYELYLNEGDGIPDRDFVFRKTQKISDNKVDEYCLCEIDEDEEDGVQTTASFSLGHRQSSLRFDSFGSSSSLNQSASQPNTVIVSIPTSKGESITVKIGYDETTTMKQLLIDLVEKKKHKIRLYTEEFSFIVSSDDQSRLKLMSQTVDMGALVSMFGDNTKFDLRKRAFEDSPRDSSRMKSASSKSMRPGEDSAETNTVVYNESTAVMLQQWNIIKKNKLGSKQERIMGIDGKCVYNSRRDQRPGTGVKVPYREISTIQSVEVLEDKITLRINWKEDKGGWYAIEYMCQNERDCAEIKSKIQFLISNKRTRVHK